MSEMRVVATGLQFPEGPVAMLDGSVVLAEIRRRTVTRVTPDGTVAVFSACGGGPNGIALGPDKAFYVCNHGGNEYPPNHFAGIGPAKEYVGGYIQRIDAKTGEFKTLYTHCGSNRLSAPNDIVFDSHGNFYFSDYGKRFPRYRHIGGLYYATPDGSKIVEVAFPAFAANGVGLSPDEKVLYFAETETARLWAYNIIEPGVVEKQPFPSPNGGRLLCELPGLQNFDSLAVDAQGNICVATLLSGNISVIAPDGRLIRQVKVPGIFPTNICFGGKDLRTAFVTLSDLGHLIAIDWPEPGLRLNYMG